MVFCQIHDGSTHQLDPPVLDIGELDALFGEPQVLGVRRDWWLLCQDASGHEAASRECHRQETVHGVACSCGRR